MTFYATDVCGILLGCQMLRSGCAVYVKTSRSGATTSVSIFIGFLYDTQYFRKYVLEE